MGLPTRLLTDTAQTHLDDHNVINPQAWDQWIRKAADQSVTNSTTLVNDNELSFSVASGESWVIELDISENESSTSCGINFECTFPSAYGFSTVRGANIGSTAGGIKSYIPATTTNFGGPFGTNVVNHPSVYCLHLGLGFAASGTLQFKFANGSATGTTTVKAGSILRGRKLA